MKRNYEAPDCIIENLMAEDVISASSGGGRGQDDVNPDGYLGGYY